MSLSVMSNPRLVELLVQRASEGLSAAERDELKQLLAQKPYEDAGRFEYTAAALLLAGEMDDAPLPQHLHARMMAQADELTATIPTAPVRERRTQQQVISIAGRSRATAGGAPDTQATSAPPPRGRFATIRGLGPQAGWLAAAASLLVAVVGWWPQPGEDVSVAQTVSLEDQRQALLARQDTLVRSWQPTQDPAATGVSGDVVWDPVTQQGYLRFRGLAANDVQQSQYQLWIFDATRDDAYPVDGGVFDIPRQGASADEVIVPILAKLPVREAAMFAVTVERPGGSVVSTRERIVLLAPVASS